MLPPPFKLLQLLLFFLMEILHGAGGVGLACRSCRRPKLLKAAKPVKFMFASSGAAAAADSHAAAAAGSEPIRAEQNSHTRPGFLKPASSPYPWACSMCSCAGLLPKRSRHLSKNDTQSPSVPSCNLMRRSESVTVLTIE